MLLGPQSDVDNKVVSRLTVAFDRQRLELFDFDRTVETIREGAVSIFFFNFSII